MNLMILFSLQAYWSNIFLFPKKIVRLIEQKLNRFMWNGNVERPAKAKSFMGINLCPKRIGWVGIEESGGME
jgi:hypothetical protein